MLYSSQRVTGRYGSLGNAVGYKIEVRDSSFLKVESLRCSGRGLTAPPPACVEALRALSNQLQSQCQASPAWKWVMRMFTPHSTYPPWALMGLPCYFCTPSPYWTAVKDRVGCWRHMAFPSICRQHAEPVAKQVDSSNPSTKSLALPFHGNGLVMSPLPQRLPFPSHSHRAGTPIPSCQSKQQQPAKIL